VDSVNIGGSMTKNQRLRYELGDAYRGTSSDNTRRKAKFNRVRARYNLSTSCIGGTDAKAIFVGPGSRTS